MDESSTSINLNKISVLNGCGFAKWKEHVTIVLVCMDLDYKFWVNESLKPTYQRIAYEKWEHSNCMSLMIMKQSILDSIRDAMPKKKNVKKYLSQIADYFIVS